MATVGCNGKYLEGKAQHMYLATVSYTQVIWNINHKGWLLNTNGALSVALEAGSDSELSDLSNDDDQDTTISNIPPRIVERVRWRERENAAVEDEEEENESKENLQVNNDNNNEISGENDEK